MFPLSFGTKTSDFVCVCVTMGEDKSKNVKDSIFNSLVNVRTKNYTEVDLMKINKCHYVSILGL